MTNIRRVTPKPRDMSEKEPAWRAHAIIAEEGAEKAYMNTLDSEEKLSAQEHQRSQSTTGTTEFIDKLAASTITRQNTTSNGPENTGPDLHRALPRIESLCKKRGHLPRKASLRALINKDGESLAAAGFVSSDVLWMHRFMRATHERNCTPHVDESRLPMLLPLLKTYGNTWKLLAITTSYMTFAGHRFRATCLEWAGAEECPFDNILSPEKYFGYDYGDRDWIIMRDDAKSISYGDLVPNQGGKYGFYQDSKYRLDPIEFLNFFGYKKGHLNVIQGVLKKTRAYRQIMTPSFKYPTYETLRDAVIMHRNEEFVQVDDRIATVVINLEKEEDDTVTTLGGMKNVFVKLDRNVADGYIHHLNLWKSSILTAGDFTAITAAIHAAYILL